MPARLASALALLIVAGTASWAGGVAFLALLALAGALAAYEWSRLCRLPPLACWLGGGGAVITGAAVSIGSWGGAVLALATTGATLLVMGRWRCRLLADIAWAVAGVLYIVVAVTAAARLRAAPEGLALCAWLLLAVIATDTGAYIVGRTMGGPKLAPSISPGKTVSGLLGGIAAAAAVSIAVSMAGMLAEADVMPMQRGVGVVAAIGAAIAVTAQAGDLLESWLKRRAGVKDSGTLIPGHGGVLDRLDGYLAATPMFAVLILVLGV